MNEPQNDLYILICSDAECIDNDLRAAERVAKTRLKRGLWPLYRGTRNRKVLDKGDICLIYLAGGKKWAQHLYATAVVARKRDRKRFETIDSEDLLMDAPDQVLELEDIFLIKPLSIRAFLGKLSFLKSSKWGASFQGGCRRVNLEDRALLESHIFQMEKI